MVRFIEKYSIEIATSDEHSKPCEFDYISFQDGPFSFSRSITRICGMGGPADRTVIRSTTRFMRARFKTDHNNERYGFVMRYDFEPIPGLLLYKFVNQKTDNFFPISLC